MSRHAEHDHHRPGAGAHREEVLAELLDLDAAVFGAHLAAEAWVVRHAPADVRRVLDLGAGTGVGTVALARWFPAAEVVAVDRSPAMLARVGAAARAAGVGDRVRLLEADLAEGWVGVAGVDVVWASSSLHELPDPDRTLGEVRAALRPRGLLVVVEVDGPPQLLPAEVGDGLEARLHAAVLRQGSYAHPDWSPHLERAGLEVVARETFRLEGDPTSAPRYARASLRHLRDALADVLGDEDRRLLDQLLHEEDGVLGGAVPARTSRTAWIARRPGRT